MNNETKHTPVEMICEHKLIASLNYGPNDVECSICGKCWVELNSLTAAAPKLLEELAQTERYCNALIKRANEIDKLLLATNGMPFEGEIGEITFLQKQLERNRALITQSTVQ